MKTLLAILALAISINTSAQTKPTPAELDTRFEAQWDKETRKAAATAGKAAYLSDKEKGVYYYLNLARLNPKLFADTYLKDYEGSQKYTNHKRFDKYKKTLTKQLEETAPMSALIPNKELHQTADCFARYIGKNSLMTHDRGRSNCPEPPRAENISFGEMHPLEIVMDLLIDPFDETLGHRRNYLNPNYAEMGVAVAKHEKYGECTVSDF